MRTLELPDGTMASLEDTQTEAFDFFFRCFMNCLIIPLINQERPGLAM